MADLQNSKSQDKSSVEVTADLNKLKLLISASNKQRLQSCLENQNISLPDERDLKHCKVVEVDAQTNTASSEKSDTIETDKSISKLKISSKEANSFQNAVTLNCESSPAKMDIGESFNELDFSSDCVPTNLDDLLNASDSDDLLCAISLKKEFSEECSDNDEDGTFLKFSTQLQHSDSKPMVYFNDLSLWDKQKVPALQIGIGIPEPVLSAEETGFSKHVLRVLKEIKFFGPSCVQSVIWPSMDRGRSVLVIAPPHSGKTVSYVLPIVSRFTAEKTPEEDAGPVSIILCSTWVKAQDVHKYFNLFFDNFKIKIVTLCTEGGNYKNKMQSVINKCDILIATPHCLFKVFQQKNISLARLEDFILDDGSNIMDRNKRELKEILLHLMEARNRAECSPQLVICAERWNTNFQIILDKVMPTPLVFFTSFLEAAVYAKIPINTHIYAATGEKKMALLGILKNAGRVVICTTSISDSLEIHHFIRRFHYKSYLVNEEMEHYLMDDVIKGWKSDNSGTTSVSLIITDQCLIKMPVSNANCLIHYDIPAKSRLQFGNRFSCIAEHLTGKGFKEECVCHVLLMRSEYYFAPHLLEITANCGTPYEHLLELMKKKYKDEIDSEELCHYMKAFGHCKKRNCKSRHVIDSTIDRPQVIPCEGDFHGVVTHIIDASHYYVRGIKYLDPISNKTVSLIATYAKIGFQLRDFYIHAPEELKIEKPVVGESYVLEEENKVFFRIKILEYFPEISTQLEKWKILYLDEGWIKYSNKLNLYKLTDQIKLPEPVAVEVYLCNVMTLDSCLDWNPQTSELVSDLIRGKEVHGKIVLCIGKTLWMEPLALTIKLPDGNYAYPFKVNQKLFDFGHARKNKKHLRLLHKACINKISLPHITKTKSKEVEVVEEKTSVQYAFLECNVYEDVYVSSVVSPQQLYIQRAKFTECLDDLLDKINLHVEKRKLKKACSVYKDMLCIALFHEDNRYYRAIITDIVSNDEVQLFFVDFGDTGRATRKNIYCLTEEFLMLPFQAIECELAGIAAPHGSWSQSAVNTLIIKTRDASYDMKILSLKAYHKTSCYMGGNHYVIDLWDDEKKITDELLQAGFGLPTDINVDISDEVWDNSSTQSNNEIFNLDDECPTSEDEELDPEDKEITAQFYGVLAKMISEEFNLYPKPPTITEVSSDDDEILKKCEANNLPVSSDQYNTIQKLLPKLTELKKDEPSNEILSNSVRPLITWWDTPDELNIMIMLKDIKIYQLDITDDGFSFSTIINGVHYATEENFYDKVHSQDAKKCFSNQGISVIAKKRTHFKWPRFTKEKKKFIHIKYDLIHIDDSDSEESPKDTNEHMRYFYEEEGSSTSDEEETYVEPWKEFAKTKDIFSELS